jgi:hypothetical protein
MGGTTTAKLAGDPNARKEIGACASIEELKALVMTHLERLAPVLGFEALMAPADGIPNGDMRQAGAGNGTGADRSR